MNDTLSLAQALIQRPSVTPDDAGCQKLIAERLRACGFSIEHLPFADVSNLWACHGQQGNGPLFVFLGHTDVVPTGPEEAWRYPPFTATIDDDGYLHGRGSADMKGSLAAIVTAMQRFATNHPNHHGRIALLITSDEEGPATDGTRKVVDWLSQRGEQIDWCLVGEPSSDAMAGDTVKNGRRGSLGGLLTIRGVQGHVAYPHLASNPIHAFAPVLSELSMRQWDQGNEFFPPTTFQISNIHGGTGASNVIPGELEILFNFRFSTENSAAALRQGVEDICQQAGLDFSIDWQLSGLPFLTAEGELLEATQKAIKAVTGIDTHLSTAGGTSDGRFIAPTGAQVIELGPVNATIHKVNEKVATRDLEQLTRIYEQIMTELLGQHSR